MGKQNTLRDVFPAHEPFKYKIQNGVWKQHLVNTSLLLSSINDSIRKVSKSLEIWSRPLTLRVLSSE